jgi:protein O-GlcNAc transferase
MRRALEIVPHSEFHSGVLFEMNYLPDATPESLQLEACRWNACHAAPFSNQIRPHPNNPDPERRLKVGYASPDLFGHPIAKFLIPVLEYHHRARFEIFVYSIGDKEDNITDHISQIRRKFRTSASTGC